jgi:hypothetical protein
VQCTTNGHPPLISLSYRCHENLARSDPSSILHNVNSCGLTQLFRKSQTLYNKFCFSSLYHSHKDTSPGSTTELTSTQIALRRSQNANVPERSSRDQLQSLPAKSSSTTVTRGRVLKAHRILKPTVLSGPSTKTWAVRRKQVTCCVASNF